MRLNVEQRRIIENKPNGHVLVKGVAGSGKTTVAVHKIPFLLKDYTYEKDDKILVITYNKSLINYIKYIYEEIERNKENEQLTLGIYESGDKDKLYIETIDNMMFKYFTSYIKEEKLEKLRVATEKQINKAMVEAINVVKQEYEKVNVLDRKNLTFIIEEIRWMKSCNYTDIEEYQTIDRIGRISNNNVESTHKLRKNSKIRKAIFEVMIQYNDNLKKEKLVDLQDVALMALRQAKREVGEKYTHIIVDETQDLTRVQLEFIKTLYMNRSYSSMLFVSDTAQSIYPEAWLVKGRSFTSIGLDMTGKSTSLSKSYRTTMQIAYAAYSLIEDDKNILEDDNFVKPSLIDKQGVYPVYRGFKNKVSEAEYIAETIENELKNKYDYKDIAIISKFKNQLKDIKIFLEKNNIPYKELESNEELDFNEDCVKLLTMHCAKGLQFKAVIIAGLNDKIIPSRDFANEFEDSDFVESIDRRLLYVGMTRATEELFLSSYGNPSKFIKDISCKYLRINSKCNFRKLHRIDIDEYLFTYKIDDIYKSEEITRQWIISELMNRYGYPKDLIDVEVKVNIEAKAEVVDIVVYVYENKDKVPFIFIKSNKLGAGTESEISHLKICMNIFDTVKYGVVTDGNEIVIINDDFEEVDDIPSFNKRMISSVNLV
ncbi:MULTISPECIES: UvrD-helicase domain-containing protein [Clostridium]|mgnify:FL=1|uniref:UvrD-helicase domain-containing protein n=1 Tax=Clostridium TaxID=1485 RepID=UPI0006C25DFC|nr:MULTISPECIES: UvrD-helicase domain-containing protein [Clostridium]MDU7455283.1 3'-5' exonuclease [Clostridium saudiense]CUP02116.1 LexA repressor [Clostridium disporicum]SCJ92526.1 ATP-dependent DNA helicase rep [uncultured Clostridium sp.]